MTYQTNPQRSGFRELSAEELTAVGGGNGGFVVTANRPSSGNIWSGSGDGALGLGSGLSAFQLPMDLSALAGLATLDWGTLAEWIKESGYELPSPEEPTPADLDGDGEPGITVAADRSTGLPVGFVLAPGNDMFMYRVDANGNQVGPLVFSPEGLERYNTDVMANFDWSEFAADMGTIATGSVAGAGNGIRAVIGIVGGGLFGGMSAVNEP